MAPFLPQWDSHLKDDLVDSDVTDVVAGGELCETRDVPDDGEDDHGNDVDGAGEAAEPVPGGEDHQNPLNYNSTDHITFISCRLAS